mmetsp:Transcript_63889/g.88220  ORF Transcript_63889/g.88220 Transcript_63889/m.88220 type:complete len:286 (-) Transcript_63889:41-898(-)
MSSSLTSKVSWSVMVLPTGTTILALPTLRWPTGTLSTIPSSTTRSMSTTAISVVLLWRTSLLDAWLTSLNSSSSSLTLTFTISMVPAGVLVMLLSSTLTRSLSLPLTTLLGLLELPPRKNTDLLVFLLALSVTPSLTTLTAARLETPFTSLIASSLGISAKMTSTTPVVLKVPSGSTRSSRANTECSSSPVIPMVPFLPTVLRVGSTNLTGTLPPPGDLTWSRVRLLVTSKSVRVNSPSPPFTVLAIWFLSSRDPRLTTSSSTGSSRRTSECQNAKIVRNNAEYS